MKITVYADVLFLINFIINLILLKISSLFMKNTSSIFRMSVSSAIGAVYAVCMFFPDISFLYIFPFKLIISVIMIKILCPGARIIKTIKFTAVFYMVSFTFAGVLLALIYVGSISSTANPIMHNGIFYFDISIGTLLTASGVSYALIAVSTAIFKRNKTLGIKNLTIVLSDRMCELTALSDTGNLLTDPISSFPVIIAEKKRLKPLFPHGVPSMEAIDQCDVKMRLIPYSSLGCESGMLTGFVPDEVQIDGKKTCRVIVAMSSEALSKSDEYNALFNPNILI